MKFRKPTKRIYEYWIDEDEFGKIIPIKMPYKYVIESFCDMVGASKAYNGDNWTEELVYKYWIDKCKGKRIQHPTSERYTEMLIIKLKEMGEKEFLAWYKKNKHQLEIDYTTDVKQFDN